ncbi:DUF6152 family protein [Lutibaculum baratangense]|uniref:DUF5666 domain-containing protein n=1 Tax=Lutibaculum baratangense AMV1 TaxID=631454 RepID=V4RL81_9HYPH|nr:DUF6152 family protein [Lutibaculum baratangense]ESR26811.1 hypothetical protein N177_0595 [Lutibaculum baratangense AMV1]
MKRVLSMLTACAMGAAVTAAPAAAHHGWNWTTGENRELTGTITGVSLGNPHGTLEVEVDGETWTVEVGQPWRNERAGLREGDLAEGVEATFVGEASSDTSDRRLKVERLVIDGQTYELYPGRD